MLKAGVIPGRSETTRPPGDDWAKQEIKGQPENGWETKGVLNLMKKLVSLILAIMMIAMVGAAFATNIYGNTETGVAGMWTDDDTPITQDKTINIRKEITAFNPNETLIYGPEIKYTYTIASASGNELVSITDEPGDHASNLATTATALGAEAITSGTPVITGQNNDGTTTNQIRWFNTDILEASASGTANYKTFAVDFSNVVFSKPGVYRYKITETADAYTTSGVTHGTSTNIRYLDVYVKRSDSSTSPYALYTDGSSAAQWIIYGYVCIDSSYDDDAVSPSTKKTSGFVAKSEDETGSGTTTADQYHTYNLTVGKTLSGDTTMNSHQFPFDIAFSNGTTGTATETFQFAVKTSGTATVTHTDNTATTSVNRTDVAAAALPKVGSADVVTTTGKDGDPTIASGATVTYIGIPTTVKATVTETNDVAGTTYSTRVYAETWTTTYATPTTQVGFTDGTAAKGDENSITNALATVDESETAIYAQANAAAVDTNQAIQFTNTLALISPTGYVSRFAPYALILIGGIALLIIAKKRRPKEEEE